MKFELFDSNGGLSDGVAIIFGDFFRFLRVEFDKCAKLASNVFDEVLDMNFLLNIWPLFNDNLSVISGDSISL